MYLLSLLTKSAPLHPRTLGRYANVVLLLIRSLDIFAKLCR